MGRLLFQKVEFRGDSSWTLGQNFLLCFTSSGNLELWDRTTAELVWETGTRAEKMVMQGDGNLVIYAAGEEPVWSSGTHGNPDAFFCVEDDGTLAVLSANLSRKLWSRQAHQNVSHALRESDSKEASEGSEPTKPTVKDGELSADAYRSQLASLEPAVRSRR